MIITEKKDVVLLIKLQNVLKINTNMSNSLKKLLPIVFGMAAMCDPLSNTVYSTSRDYTPAPRKKQLYGEEALKAKGLQEFEINGIKIIAHNEKEAMKRYKHRIKNK